MTVGNEYQKRFRCVLGLMAGVLLVGYILSRPQPKHLSPHVPTQNSQAAVDIGPATEPRISVNRVKWTFETDGMIGFIPNTNKAVFEINLSTIEAAKLKISSKLIPLAKRVINE